jgi:hypothetical protein
MERKYSAPTPAAPQAGASEMINLQISASCAYSLDDIWSSLVVPEKLAVWMLPIKGQLSKGGAIELGQGAHATITACEPKRRLAFSLTQGALMQGVAITLGEEGKGKAKQRLLRVNISANRSALSDEVWANYGPASLGIAWELTCKALFNFLERPLARAEFITYARSAEAVQYVNTAYADWRAQSIAYESGDDFMPLVPQTVLKYYNGLQK